MQKLKVMSIVGKRHEIIRLSRVMAKLDQHCEHYIVHTGQNYDYELNEVFFSDLGIRKPDRFLGAAGATAAERIGQELMAADKLAIDATSGVPGRPERLFEALGQRPAAVDLLVGQQHAEVEDPRGLPQRP